MISLHGSVKFDLVVSSFFMIPMNIKKVLALTGFGMKSVNRVQNITYFGIHMDLVYGENLVENLWNPPCLDIC